MLLGAKPFIALAVVAIALSFAMGLLHWNKDKATCMVRRDWKEGSWHTYFAIGRLEWRVKDFDCDHNFKLDPEKWQNDGFGTITPKLDNQ